MAIEILIVDDEDMIRWTLRDFLETEGYKVYEFPRGKDFLSFFRERGGDIVFLDIRLPDVFGLDVLSEIQSIDSSVQVVIMTAFGDVETAVTAMKHGACDYISKPYDLAEINHLIKKIIDTSLLKNQLTLLKEKIGENFNEILGDHPKMRTVREHISLASQSDSTTILIRGESGTGKELVARQIHLQSNRRSKPFIDVNAASVSETLLESELFGHERGAFTDALHQKKGLFELAHEGTLFLDEIGDLSPHLQAKLLRVLQERRFRRVGGSSDINVDVRIITATNADLEISMEKGVWRRDLFYRLNVFSIFLPPLREHPEDIMLLAKFFLEKFRREFSKEIRGFYKDSSDLLQAYFYPGNVRELKNLIERATILETGNQISVSSLPEELRTQRKNQVKFSPVIEKPWEKPGFKIRDYVNSLEKQILVDVLNLAGWKKNNAARMLGLTRYALRHHLQKHGLENNPEEKGDLSTLVKNRGGFPP
ncbi:sigma-54-dependent Fis family transcriptional regulator [bacterium]|nr:sigma-54-dependent Fis family transcriptional regulator [bacterium]